MRKEFSEFPKQLYRSGWDDLTDTIVVDDAEGEEQARVAGFKMLAELPLPNDGDEPDVQVGEDPDEGEAQKPRRGRKPKAEA
jgi:hypothetical protein